VLSGRGEEEAQLCEQVLGDAGADWTIVRSNWFNQTFSGRFLLESVLGGGAALRGGGAALPAAAVGEPFIDAADIADVAVAALTEDGHPGQLYEVTGPRLLTSAEAVQEIAKAAERQTRFGRAHLVDGIQQALGRAPRDYTGYARAAASGIWDSGR